MSAPVKWLVGLLGIGAAGLYVTWPLIERDWAMIVADAPGAENTASNLRTAPVDKCFELIHVNPPRGYAYIFDACRGSVAQVLVPLPPSDEPAPQIEPGNPEIES